MKLRTHKLGDLADIRAGFPFRGAIEPSLEGDVGVVQMKNVNEISQVDWRNLTRTRLEGKRSPDWLEAGDILFLARGNRNFAVCLDTPPPQTVCSPHFFQIHVKNSKKILPAFLAWQINQAPAQQYLKASAEGGLIGNIRRSVLESLTITVPALEQQHAVMRLDDLLKHEHMLLQQRIENNHKMMRAVANRFFAEALNS